MAGAGRHPPHRRARLQAWARPLEGGAVAVVAANLGGVPGQHVCVSVREVVRTAGRVWEGGGEEEEGGDASTSSLCWRPVSLAPRARPLTSFRPWTEEASFPHKAQDQLCLAGPDAGSAAVVVGRPCAEGGEEAVGSASA